MLRLSTNRFSASARRLIAAALASGPNVALQLSLAPPAAPGSLCAHPHADRAKLPASHGIGELPATARVGDSTPAAPPPAAPPATPPATPPAAPPAAAPAAPPAVPPAAAWSARPHAVAVVAPGRGRETQRAARGRGGFKTAAVEVELRAQKDVELAWDGAKLAGQSGRRGRPRLSKGQAALSPRAFLDVDLGAQASLQWTGRDT